MAVVEPRLGSVRGLRVVIAPLTVAAGFASVLLVPHSGALLTTYSAGSGLARAADVIAGMSLLAAGLATLIARRNGSIGIVAMLAGAAWFAPDWVGWEGGAPLVRSIAMVVAPFVVPLLFHVALAAPNGRLAPAAARAVVVVLYGVAAVASLGLALFRDPFLDRYCWSNCTENVFVVRPEQEVARLLREALLLAVLAGATVVVALTARRFVRASRTARRVVMSVAISGAFLGAAAGHVRRRAAPQSCGECGQDDVRNVVPRPRWSCDVARGSPWLERVRRVADAVGRFPTSRWG